MFSSEELISFVFANESDIYYGDDLLKLNLDQLLWKRLHENYETVYFLRAQEGLFQVRTFGDRTANPDWKKNAVKLWGKSDYVKQGSWLQRQLRATHQRAAFVCSLEDFCTVLDNDRWEETLREIASAKKRSGKIVLTVPVTAEHSCGYLLHSRVFDWLGEKAVTDARGGSLRPLYSQIKSGKGKDCMFLNVFTWERIRDLLVHITMEHPDRCCDASELEALAKTLAGGLNDPGMGPTEIFPESDGPLCYLRCRDLYARLQDDQVWEKLLRWKDACEVSSPERPELLILRDKKGFAGKCTLLSLPKWLRERQDDGPWAAAMLDKIKKAVAVPKNRPENPEVVALIVRYLDQLNAFSVDDAQTYKWLLKTIEFCTQWLYIDAEGEEFDEFQKIMECLDACIATSNQCYMLQRNLSVYQSQNQCGSLTQKKLTQKKLAQMKENLEVSSRMCREFQDIADSSILEFSMPRGTGDHDRLLEKLQTVVNMKEKATAEQEAKNDGDEYIFIKEDYDVSPRS